MIKLLFTTISNIIYSSCTLKQNRGLVQHAILILDTVRLSKVHLFKRAFYNTIIVVKLLKQITTKKNKSAFKLIQLYMNDHNYISNILDSKRSYFTIIINQVHVFKIKAGRNMFDKHSKSPLLLSLIDLHFSFFFWDKT